MYDTWTLLGRVVRAYTAKKTDNFDLHVLKMCTYGIAAKYFSVKALIYDFTDLQARKGLFL